MTETLARTLLGIFGVVLLLFGLGQAFGLDLLGVIGDALASPTARWLTIAFIGVLMIVGALGGFRRFYY